MSSKAMKARKKVFDIRKEIALQTEREAEREAWKVSSNPFVIKHDIFEAFEDAFGNLDSFSITDIVEWYDPILIDIAQSHNLTTLFDDNSLYRLLDFIAKEGRKTEFNIHIMSIFEEWLLRELKINDFTIKIYDKKFRQEFPIMVSEIPILQNNTLLYRKYKRESA